MPNLSPESIRSDAEDILKVWTANPEFKLKDVTLDTFRTETERFTGILARIDQKEEELKPLRNDRDDTAVTLNALCTRARAGVKGYFGENSSEYEAVGGIRSSERRKGTGRKPKTPEAK